MVYFYYTTYAPLPNKFEAGTQNVEGVVGLGAAIDYIESIGYETINKVEQEVTEYAVNELSKLNFIEMYVTPNRQNHSSVVSFNVKGVHPHDVASILDVNGVCIRSGNHCAQPLLRYMGMDSTCRASFSIYNTKEDVDKLVDALNKTYKMFEKYINKAICEYSRRNNTEIPLRVCWESSGGSNCCKCEKCYRTLFGIIAEKENPRKYGFNYTDKEFEEIVDDLKNRIFISNFRWKYIQDEFRNNYNIHEVDKNLRWFYKTDIKRIDKSLKKQLLKGKKKVSYVINKLSRKVKLTRILKN